MRYTLPVATLLATLPSCLLAQGTPAEPILPTITVTGQSTFPVTTSITGVNDLPLKDIPAAISVVTRQQIDDSQARVMSGLAQQDASVTENYAPVGYYENLAVRGFALDHAGSYQINGMTVVGEQVFALENKESVDLQKGLPALLSGQSTPGGLVNFTTKKPARVRSVFAGVTSEGGHHVAADIGTIFGEMDQFGIRINAAREELRSHVTEASGYRNFASLSAHWQLSRDALLQFDTDYQVREQPSVSGYQLLGGKTIPTGIDRTKLLGYQSWMPPVKMNSHNAILRLDVRLAPDWQASLSASRSRSVIDDNVAFAFGYQADGSYEIFDYRSPNDDRRIDQLRAAISGNIQTGDLRHEVQFAASTQRRLIDKSDGLFDDIGTGNIYAPNPALSPSENLIPAAYLNLDSRLRTLSLTDKLVFSDTWQVIAGVRHTKVHDRNFGWISRNTRATHNLPQFAILWQPTGHTTVYTSYAKNLLFSGQAPSWASNAYAFLPPTLATQVEAGIRHEIMPLVQVNAAVFRLRKPYEYPKPGSGPDTYVQQGTQTHDGLELSLQGQLRRLHLNTGITLLRAQAKDSGTPAYDNRQGINAPRVRAAVHATYQLADLPGTYLLSSWIYSSSKAANRDGTATVPAYHVVNTGLRHERQYGKSKATIRLMVDNVFNKFYWKDVGEFLGDGYLHPGAPRTARLSLQYDF